MPYTNEQIDDIIASIREDFDAEDFTSGGMSLQSSLLDSMYAPMPWAGNNPWDWATDRIAVGGDDYIQSQDLLDRMADEGVTHIIDCRREASHDARYCGPSYLPHSKTMFTYRNFPTGDDGAPKSVSYFRGIIDFALEALRDPSAKLYVHCAAGYNRGPTGAYAILRALGMSDSEAADAIHSVRTVGLAYQDDARRAINALGFNPKLRARKSRRSDRNTIR